MQGELIHKELTEQVLGAAIEVHKLLGPGFLESNYEDCLCYELDLRHIPYERQVPFPLVYKDLRLDSAFRLDLVIDNKIVVELKSVEAILPIHQAQLTAYLKVTGLRVGLLLNFNVAALKDGIIRRVL